MSTRTPSRSPAKRARQPAVATTKVAKARPRPSTSKTANAPADAPAPFPEKTASIAAAPKPPRVVELAQSEHWTSQACRLTEREYGQLSILKDRAQSLARPIKRGEILRVGLGLLAMMSDAQLFDAINSVALPRPPRKK